MAAEISKAQALTPVLTFVSFIVLGIIVALYIVSDPFYTVPIILAGFFIGLLLAAAELRLVIIRNRQRAEYQQQRKSMSDEERKNQLARFVADLFDEDIPFDELKDEEHTKDQSTSQTNHSEEMSSTNGKPNE